MNWYIRGRMNWLETRRGRVVDAMSALTIDCYTSTRHDLKCIILVENKNHVEKRVSNI